MEVKFEGENLLPGIIGYISILTVFFTAFFGAITYFIASTSKDLNYKPWINISRMFFAIQFIGVIIIFSCMYYIILNHRFEYRYAWEHSSMQLPFKYILSCFWEGQEGSFLLWMFWNGVLGMILMFSTKKWEAEVMFTFCLVQLFLGSMILGIYIFDYKIGSNPFVLMRDYMVDAPIFQRADYLSFIKDGNGLNPLLQNYWMVIHPPTLFLGFASTLVPFAYVIAALWRKDFIAFTKPTLTWSLFSGAILGTGIMMGAAWAYESLTFGGYWAWDPVENASLVPWLVLIGGVHTLLAYKKTGHSLKITIAFFLLSFILVLYSTFLTRSGILGDTSVHAFTDLGMSGQLVFYMAALSIPALVLFFIRWKDMPQEKREEELYSREFWMFIGSLLLFLSAIHITWVTSIPVYNAIFGTKKAPPTNAVQFYNQWQLPFAVIIAIISSASLFLKFKKTELKYFGKKLLINLLLSTIVTAVLVYVSEIYYFTYIALLFSGIFSLIANAYYFGNVFSGKWKISGPAIAHFGFGLILVGILYSSLKQETISRNTLGIDFGKDFDEQAKRDNMLLYRDIPSKLGDYIVTYIGDSAAPPNYYYKVQYERYDSIKKKVVEKFILHPNAQINPKMGLIANPDTRHYLGKDIYTHVTSVPDKTQEEKIEDDKYVKHEMKIGDTVFTKKYFVQLQNVQRVERDERIKDLSPNDIAVKASIAVKDMNGFARITEPIFFIRGNQVQPIVSEEKDLGLNFRFSNIDPQRNIMTIEIADYAPQQDYIVMKAIVFPHINLLWLGIIICVSGFVISIIKIFIKDSKKSNPTA